MSSSPTIDLADRPHAVEAPDASAVQTHGRSDAASALLICLPSLAADVLPSMLATISAAFPREAILIASPDRAAEETQASFRWVPYTSPRAQDGWILTAADYLTAANLARDHKAHTTLLLGMDAASISANTLRDLAEEASKENADLVVPQPIAGPTEGLVTSALLYPLTRALFAADVRFPIPVNAAFSQRMAQRLGVVAQRHVGAGSPDAIIWPVAEAAVAGFYIREVPVEQRLPQPPAIDFNTLFTTVSGSLFADIDAKATFWQRARSFSAGRGEHAASSAITASEVSPEVASLAEGFHLAYSNLQDIWSLVLPPQSLLALKRLAMAPADAFTIAPNLWARIVYDFALGFHLRTINRGHLLGALTPLYLAWVASHIRSVEAAPERAPQLSAEGAIAFEVEKPYLVSRWRWPDRFNP